ncbi:D-inositol-3-phosphate glycosyltransferase [uncultured Avibacterium sp.]|uniref:D-inositol-3-phosphate glycosyltransferase n=1 Tax=uncultured Avibacterium sp. TaxID=1936169 RepID=A0A486XCD6_9PAST|nr:D-inositol-3-phosphate glycosyltransferase [uncultured Avibacterium sp.]
MNEIKPAILFINMAKGFGGGEFQTEQLMLALPEYKIYFFGKKNGKFIQKLRQYKNITVLNLFQLIKLVLSKKPLIIHAQDGRGAHIAGFLKLISGKSVVITRHVAFPFKRKSSIKSYKNADMLVGVSEQVSHNLRELNSNVKTIYGCIKPLLENNEFEQTFFSEKNEKLSIAHIGNLQKVKNFELTIELAKNFPEILFYIVGSGELEQALKEQASNLKNVIFIPFTPYIGSVFKNVDLQIVPSHSEGLGAVILEGYQYGVPAIANAVGGIPDIIENNKTGYLIKHNTPESYQEVLKELLNNPEQLVELKANIKLYMQHNDFSAISMARQYSAIYDNLLSHHS